uniref:ML domain-containing protein n=1 Tax=Steinernema glaseri TaxID=37863 RepID=A0A1I7Z482_9BILA
MLYLKDATATVILFVVLTVTNGDVDIVKIGFKFTASSFIKEVTVDVCFTGYENGTCMPFPYGDVKLPVKLKDGQSFKAQKFDVDRQTAFTSHSKVTMYYETEKGPFTLCQARLQLQNKDGVTKLPCWSSFGTLDITYTSYRGPK